MSTYYHLYPDSPSTWEAMLEACRQAKYSIALEQFILTPDTVGLRFINVLREQTRRGVQVRLLCDAVGSFELYRSQLAYDLATVPNFEIAFFNHLIPWTPKNYTLWYFRNHRKTLLIDSTIAYTGSICLDEETRPWRETNARISGPVVTDIIRAFNTMWDRAHKRRQRRPAITTDRSAPWQYLTNSPLPRQNYLYRALIKATDQAREYIYLTTPYFLPTHKLLRHLKRAAKRGVDVRLLIPHYSDHPVVDLGSATYFHDTLNAGIKIYRYQPGMIHAKTVVIDSAWSTVGSMNLDNVSLRYNFEGNLVSTDTQFAAELAQHFIADSKQARELTLATWRARPLLNKTLEWLVWPLRKLL